MSAEMPACNPHLSIETHLSRIEAFEPKLSTFVSYDPEAARQQTALQTNELPLSGMVLGVKDIIDAVPYATGCGSPIFTDLKPHHDAACVASLKSAGAVVIGKTVTTEFAFFSPGTTCNPYDPKRTPGGSSSGSAAAVAAGFIDVGLGSQTAASITRPASYCGVVGFKPSYGSYSLVGVKGLAPSFDTLGALTRDVKTMAAVHTVLANTTPQYTNIKATPPKKIAVCRTSDWHQADPCMHDTIASATAKLGDEAEIIDVNMDAYAEGPMLHAAIMAFEARQNLANEMISAPESMSAVLRNMLLEGEKITREEHIVHLKRAIELRKRAEELTQTYDLLIAPAATGEAPIGLHTTGNPIFSRLWTLLHLPTITLPGFVSKNGMPIGVQLLAGLYQDDRLLAHALWAESLFPDRPLLDLTTL